MNLKMPNTCVTLFKGSIVESCTVPPKHPFFFFFLNSFSNHSTSFYSLSTLIKPPSALLLLPLHTLCLKVRLVPVNFEDPQFKASYQQSVALYARYQMAIHGDDPSACSESEVLHDYYYAPTVGHHFTCLFQLFAAFLF